MNRMTRMLGLALAGLGVAGLAQAGCSNPEWLHSAAAAGTMHPMVYHPGAGAGRFIPVHDNDNDGPAIVGLWKFEMISKSTPANRNPMPDGTLIDFGTAVWHDDGTEFQNSGIRLPSDGDVCQGVWAGWVHRPSSSTTMRWHGPAAPTLAR